MPGRSSEHPSRLSFFDPGGVRVKICGITNPGDAALCIAAGADALGFNFYSGSKRGMNAAEAIPWIREIGGAVARVAVVVNASSELLEEIRSAGCFEAIQFHGDESPAECEHSGYPLWIKAVRVSGEEVLGESLAYRSPHILFDGWAGDAYGGTGKRPDWNLIRKFVNLHPERRFLLAGGLNAENVREAVRVVRPHAVDVASGVEVSPRKKDPDLVAAFLREAKTTQAG